MKNVASIGARDARQIAAEATYASQNGLSMSLYTRTSTNLNRIQGLIDSGAISMSTIPGVGTNGFRVLTSGEAALSGSLMGGFTNSLK